MADDSNGKRGEYRQWLVAAEQKSQEEFDKTVLALSGGGLGLTFAFLENVIGDRPVVCTSALMAAWMAWGLSVISVLSSYYFSHLALRKAIGQVDDGTIGKGKAGGAFSVVTAVLNAGGAVALV